MKISLVINTKNPNPAWLLQALLSAEGFDEKIVYFDGEIEKEENNGAIHLGDGRSRSIPEGFNYAISHAKGDWICSFCSDDFFNTSHLKECIAQMKEGKFDEAGIVHFPVNVENHQGGSWGSASVNDDIYMTNMIPFGSFYRREVFEKLRGYHTDLKVFHDWNFWLRAYKAKFIFKFFPLPVYTFRMGHNSASLHQLEEVGGMTNAAEMVRAYA